jgi:hypothetical protein
MLARVFVAVVTHGTQNDTRLPEGLVGRTILLIVHGGGGRGGRRRGRNNFASIASGLKTSTQHGSPQLRCEDLSHRPQVCNMLDSERNTNTTQAFCLSFFEEV